MDNYNYPMGADGPDAPWNQCEPDEKDFDLTMTQTLCKSATVCSTRYTEDEGLLHPEEDFIYSYSSPEKILATVAILYDKYKNIHDEISKHQFEYLLQQCSMFSKDWQEVETDVEVD